MCTKMRISVICHLKYLKCLCVVLLNMNIISWSELKVMCFWIENTCKSFFHNQPVMSNVFYSSAGVGFLNVFGQPCRDNHKAWALLNRPAKKRLLANVYYFRKTCDWVIYWWLSPLMTPSEWQWYFW